MRPWVRTWLSGALVLVLVVGAAHRATSTSAGDASSASALRAVATTFNDNYGANRVGAVYDRFDAASRAVISRADYVRRHLECPDPPGVAHVTRVSRASAGYWLVHYEISGVVMTDYWHFVEGRWLFSLPKSNPAAVALYRLPFRAYARALGCGL